MKRKISPPCAPCWRRVSSACAAATRARRGWRSVGLRGFRGECGAGRGGWRWLSRSWHGWCRRRREKFDGLDGCAAEVGDGAQHGELLAGDVGDDLLVALALVGEPVGECLVHEFGVPVTGSTPRVPVSPGREREIFCNRVAVSPRASSACTQRRTSRRCRCRGR